MIKAGFFGKLPPFADFIRYNANQVGGLDEWLQVGISLGSAKLGGAWRSVFENSSCRQFLFVEGDVYLAGAWIASRDESGRLFPFILFVAVAKDDVDDINDVSHLLRFSDMVVETIDSISSATDGESIIEGTKKLEGACLNLAKTDCLRGVGQNSFWADMFGDAEDIRKFFIFQQVKEVLTPFAGAPEKLKLALNLPMTAGMPENQLVAAVFWCGLFQAILQNKSFVPNMVWEKKKSVFLFPVKMQAQGFLSVIKDDYNNDNVYAPLLDGIGMIDKVVERMSLESKNILKNENMSLLDLLSF